MQVWRSTSTMPSARLNDAPVGQTSTQGGSAQCWHITGADFGGPPRRSFSSTLRIHCADVAVFAPGSPFSLSHAATQASQSDAQRLTSTSMPQRTRSTPARPARGPARARTA